MGKGETLLRPGSVRELASWHGLVCQDRVSTPENAVAGEESGAEQANLKLEPGILKRELMVDRVEANGPASRAGLKKGDVVLRVGHQAINCGLELERSLLDYAAGDDLRLHDPACDRFIHDCDVLVNVSRNRPESRDDILVIAHGVRRHMVDQNVNAIMESEELPYTQEMYLQIPGLEVRLEVVLNESGAEAVLA